MKYVYAHTEATQPAGLYVAYVNVSQTDEGLCRLTVRQRGGYNTPQATMDMTKEEMVAFAEGILLALK